MTSGDRPIHSPVMHSSAVNAGGIYADNFKAAPYWWDHEEPGSVLESDLGLPQKCDVIVVGSGYAGLHSAITLARDGADVAVLDAEALGYGASSRNGGMVSGGVNVGKHAKLAPKQERAVLEEASLSFSWFEDFLKTEGIDASFQMTGRFVGAHCSAAWAKQAAMVAQLNSAADQGAYMVDPADTHSEIKSDFYRGGMVVERSGAVHPAKLHAGLLRVARAAGVKLFGNIKAGEIRRRASGLEIDTTGGTVAAHQIIIATNGYSGSLSEWHQRRVVPVPSYQIATEELGTDHVTALFPKHRMIADTKRLLFYFRPSPDRKRILFGGRALYLNHDAAAGAAFLRDRLIKVFPELNRLKLSHGWYGNVAYLRDGIPHLGESQQNQLPGVYHALGCHGSGVVMMSWLGHRTGLLAAGKLNSQSAFGDRALASFPLYRGYPWFLPMMGKYYQTRDWLDRAIDWRSKQ